jgi:hypothetical protein
MRTTATKTKGTCYSPDDGDYIGFLALIRQWVEEASVPIPDRVVLEFAQKWAQPVCNRHRTYGVGLRNRKQWLKELRRHAGIP